MIDDNAINSYTTWRGGEGGGGGGGRLIDNCMAHSS